ncbi:branched-chain amino acid aminotransferase [Micromonospora sp. NPDC093277]|uniref:branched-chain amino acid aminotransferase n=1 Tax=Micromonospora sp. NPDC093277 TaxID=3364291 RepID=UPI00381D72F2
MRSAGDGTTKAGNTVTDTATLGFGAYFTRHMITSTWRAGRWTPLQVTDHAPLVLSPAAMVLHYGQAIFEGLKAYGQPDGSVKLFRPRDNAERLNLSAERLAMPAVPIDMFLEACTELVRVDADQVPRGEWQSLYLRPTVIATESNLGVRPSNEYLFMVIASPVDHFFAGGADTIDVWCADSQIRAAPGGTGAAKCAGNYAGSLRAKRMAVENGCHEVLWLDAKERRYVEELGAMNFFCVRATKGGEPELVTPPLSGTILPGNVRASMLGLARSRGVPVAERPITLAELIGDPAVKEAFACGTAATVVPISAVVTGGERHRIGDGRSGALTGALRDDLLDIQFGRRADPFGWMHEVTLSAESMS